MPKTISIIIHNRSTYDDGFIIKQLPEKFEGKFKCLGENTEEYITYSEPIKKEVANDDDHDDDDGKFCWWLSFADSCRLMLGKLSDLVDNLSGIHNKECKKCIERKEIRSECKFIGCKNDRLNCRCKECENLCFKSPSKAIKNFPILYQFCKGNPNNLFLLLGKGYYPYEDADSWGKFDETTILSKEAFYSELNLDGMSDADYAHVQKVWEVFKIKFFGEYHNLCSQSDTLLLADVFENFTDKCIEIYDLDPTNVLTAAGLAWQPCLKDSKVELELLTYIDMLLMVEKGIRGGICQATHRYAKSNNSYMKNYDKNVESLYLEFLDANNLNGWAMSQKLPVNGLKWLEEEKLWKCNERFIKSYNEDGDKGFFLEVDVEYPNNLSHSDKDLPFLPERQKIEKVEKLVCDTNDKEKYVIHIRALKQALNHGSKLKEVHRVIQFNQKTWLKKYIDKNTKLRKNAEN